jgi:hypothetical protein
VRSSFGRIAFLSSRIFNVEAATGELRLTIRAHLYTVLLSVCRAYADSV